ncbi:MAG: exodeoxyribonuclease VII small subunit [Pirellulales bacterium]
MAKKKSTEAEGDAPSFEDSLGELEAIVGELESGKLGLSDALARYEEGVKHLKSCHQLLERVERKIELLSGMDAEGNPITEPFDEREHASLEEKAAARGRRRTSDTTAPTDKRKPAEGDIDDAHRLF